MNLLINKDDKKQAGALIFKSILGFVPGGHIVDELVEFRANVQQNRLNKFSEYFKEGFENVTGRSFEPEDLKSEGFIDAFEAIIRKVASTSSEEKLKRYRNVMLRTMYEKNESEMFFKYVNLIDAVSETQILILPCLYEAKTNTDIIRYLMNPNAKFQDLVVNLLSNEDIKIFNGQKLQKGELSFLILELKSMGLIQSEMKDLSDGGIPKEIYRLSVIGTGFLKFIEEYGK